MRAFVDPALLLGLQGRFRQALRGRPYRDHRRQRVDEAVEQGALPLLVGVDGHGMGACGACRD